MYSAGKKTTTVQTIKIRWYKPEWIQTESNNMSIDSIKTLFFQQWRNMEIQIVPNTGNQQQWSCQSRCSTHFSYGNEFKSVRILASTIFLTKQQLLQDIKILFYSILDHYYVLECTMSIVKCLFFAAKSCFSQWISIILLELFKAT